MKVRVALVGLPNVGKSTLFNALTQQKSLAQAENFPFCTIEPNISPICIPDPNLYKIAKVAKSEKALPATLTIMDVAGLVKNASKGEGLGNQFLATIRECDAIIHMIRSYENEDIVHMEGMIDPIMDAEIINLELLLADLAHVEKRLNRTNCIGEERESLQRIWYAFQEGRPARTMDFTSSELLSIKSMGLLTLKPMIYVFNVDDIDFLFNKKEALDQVKAYMEEISFCDLKKDRYCVCSAKLESELVLLSNEEKKDYLESLGLDLSDEDDLREQLSFNVLPLLVKDLLGLSFVYTGPGVPPERSKTTKTHLYKSGSMSASDLAGKLHGDIQRGFIRAEVMNFDNLIRYNNYNDAKDDGCVRIEGRDYKLESNDVVLIKWK